jgi:PBSX family phage terminase large subunit
MIFTDKQREYIREADRHRWGIKAGAVRSGKSFVDVAYTIPYNIRERLGKPGLTVILGNTKGTLQRNIIVPMQELFGTKCVSDMRADNTAQIFGEDCYCLGADNIRHVNRIRGASIKYGYGDEIGTYNPGVFDMLKSRLDKPYSRFDGTCNPDNPSHWVKAFLDSDADIFRQDYTLDDNPMLPAAFREALKKEYAGTVLYDRYILGLWVAAEGAIYLPFANDPQKHIITEAPKNIASAFIGVDFGGNGSAHAFACVGFTYRFREMILLDEWFHKGELTPQKLEAAYIEFANRNRRKYPVLEAYADNAETTLIRGLQEAATAARTTSVWKCAKKPIIDRINTEIRLFASGRFKIMEHCTHAIGAYASAVWDSKQTGKDVRLDNGSYELDILDATEYAFEHEISNLIDTDIWGTDYE